VVHFQLPSAPLFRRVLALGSHSDDIEIGCGATLLALTKARPEIEVTWVVLGAEGRREREARASAAAFTTEASRSEVVVHGFRDGFFPYVGGDLKDVFEELKSRLEPDLILTHARHDLHQDHRLVCELTWNTWRNHLILEYEIPKYDGDLGTPNVFVPVSEEVALEKVVE
jgi:LmbE family N-acetylglucosaminyl deacetylase